MLGGGLLSNIGNRLHASLLQVSLKRRLCHSSTMQTLRSIRALSLTLSVFLSALPAIAQQPSEAAQKAAPPSPTFSVKVKEVNLLAIVRDKKGQPINSLAKQDFVLEQDGRAQTITQFAHESDLPLIFGVLADTGPGQRKELADERKAGTEFVNRLLREGKDKAFVLHFDKEVELLQDMTTSHDKLAKGIDQISVGEQRSPGGGRKRDEGDREHPHYFFGGSMLYDAIFLSSDEVLKSQQGRKAVVLFSDGVDHESKTSLEHAIEAAQRADTLVYCVHVAAEREQEQGPGTEQRRGSRYPGGGYPGGGGPFPGGGYPGGGRRRGPENTPHEDKSDGKKILQRISKETGGRYLELSKKLTAAQIYAQIEEEMRHQYSLSYTPDKVENGYHKLHLSTRSADLTVQTREGFYSE
jgi:VWFA-related protein